MTPAKVYILIKKRMDRYDLLEAPIAQLASMYYNAHRSFGDKDNGIPADPPKPAIDFKIFGRRRRKALAAKDGPGGKHVLLGAKADKGAWDAFVRGKRPDPKKVKR